MASIVGFPSTLVTSNPALSSCTGMKPCPRRNVEDFLGAVLAEQLDEELAFRLSPTFPIDEFIPLVDESVDVLGLILVRLADG